MPEDEPRENQEPDNRPLPESDILPANMDKYGCPYSKETRNQLWITDSPEYHSRSRELDQEEKHFWQMRDQAPDSNTKGRMTALWYTAGAKKILFNSFGIDNLSLIEEQGLRRITDFCVENHDQQQLIYEETREKGEETDSNEYMANPSLDAAYKWVTEFCGVSTRDIPFWGVLIDKAAGKSIYFVQQNIEQMIRVMHSISKRSNEEVKKGKKYSQFEVYEGIPYYFKEYLWKQRQKNKEPEPREK